MPHRALYKRTFKGTLLPLIVFTLFFLLNGGLGYLINTDIAQTQAGVNRALSNINLINELHIEILRAESGQRGYLLTDLESYLIPYYEALDFIGLKLVDLDEGVFDPLQNERVQGLKVLVDGKLEELAATVEAVKNNDTSLAIQLVLTHAGRNLMREIRETANVIEQHERDVLEVELRAAQDSRNNAFYLILTANFVGLIMVFITLALVRGGVKKELKFMGQLQEANDTLELKVEERTSALQHSANELRRSNRELQDFAFVASHDLQEPLRKIRAFGDRLEKNYAEQLGDQGSDYIRRMQNASSRMSALLDDLLAFSRITSKATAFLPVSLNKVAEEVLDNLEVAIEEAKADISIGPLPEIDADLSQMRQLFQNLLGNAIKFRKPGVRPVISVEAQTVLWDASSFSNDQTLAIIRFIDNGIGFDEVFLERIFLPFQRLHSKSEYSGTGIGLAVCRRIVERHGGTLTATSTPGEGSIFIVTLPVQNRTYDLEEEQS